jgi:hypothetical protein
MTGPSNDQADDLRRRRRGTSAGRRDEVPRGTKRGSLRSPQSRRRLLSGQVVDMLWMLNKETCITVPYFYPYLGSWDR